MLGNRRG